MVDVVLHLGYVVVAGVWELLAARRYAISMVLCLVIEILANPYSIGLAQSQLCLRAEDGQRSQK